VELLSFLSPFLPLSHCVFLLVSESDDHGSLSSEKAPSIVTATKTMTKAQQVELPSFLSPYLPLSHCVFLLVSEGDDHGSLLCAKAPSIVTEGTALIFLYFSKISLRTKFICSDRSYHDEWFENHICKFDKHLTLFHSIFWNTGFQRLMDSPALGVSAETNDDALTGNENMQKKQRTDALEVTNPWLMGILCSKVMWLGVWGFNTF